MPCIRLRAMDGSERSIPVNTVYQRLPGETYIGRDDNCDGALSKRERIVHVGMLSALDRELGPGFGDWIKVFASPVAKLLGKSNCAGCESRRVITNAHKKLYDKYGEVRALSIIKELYLLSVKGSEDEVAIALKGYLE